MARQPEQTPPDPLTTLLAFTPVPRERDRSNGWKPQVQRDFIAALAETGSVRSACRRVGRSDNGAYQLRRHPQAGEFRAAWDTALDLGVRRIEDAAMDRALYGIEVPVLSAGKQFGTRRVFNERLVMFILRNRRPERYSEGGTRGLGAVGRMQLDRLRKQWREEWQREQWELDAEEERKATRELAEQFEQMHRNWHACLSPRARAAYRTFRRIERDDKASGYRPFDDELAEGEAEYDAGAAALDGRARINLVIEAEGHGVDAVLTEEEPAPAKPPAG